MILKVNSGDKSDSFIYCQKKHRDIAYDNKLHICDRYNISPPLKYHIDTHYLYYTCKNNWLATFSFE